MSEQKLTGYPSIDKPWLKYYSEEAINAPLPEGSMYDYMTACNADKLGEIALNYFGRKITHRRMQTEIDRCARALAACGVKAGDVVSLCLLAIPEAVYLLYAVNKLGAVANFLVLNATPQELHEQIAASKSKVVITVDLAEKQITEAVKNSCAEHIISVSLAQSMPPVTSAIFRLKSKPAPSALTSWSSFMEAGKRADPAYPDVAKESAAVIEYTGGTTGKAKGVVISNGAANSVAFQYITATSVLDIRPGQRFLDILPPFLAYGVFFGVHTAICAGLENILCPDPSPANFPNLFVRFKPHHFSGGPLHIDAMMKDKRIQKMDLSFVHTAAYGGDGMSEEQELAASQFLTERNAPYGLLKGYGMTEAAATLCTKTHRTDEMIPLARNNVRVCDLDTGEELRIGQEGEIFFSGPSIMAEYFQNPSETAEAFYEKDSVRWLRTGDLGYISENGGFHITGRIKRILWAVGPDNVPFRVYPMEIERVLCTHPSVNACAVVGLANGEKGFLPIAYVVLKDSAQGEDIRKDLAELCTEELHGNSQPYAYHFMDKLPTTPAGKVDFRALERMAAETQHCTQDNR